MTAYRMDHGHYEWSPLPARARLAWPDGARIAVGFVVSLGHYDAELPAGAVDPPTFSPPLRIMPEADYSTVTYREYGHRVGIFRLFQLFDAYRIRAVVAVDACTAERYPSLVAECRRRDWEVMAHGLSQRRAITEAMSEADERAYIRASLRAVAAATGAPPAGWLSPEQSESARTPALLAEAGVQYLSDWANDDQPYLLGEADHSLVSLPVMRELGDIGLHWNRKVTIARWSALVREAFDVLYREGASSGRLLLLPLHPWCIGQPLRVRYLEEVLAHVTRHAGVWCATGAEIAAWYRRVARGSA